LEPTVSACDDLVGVGTSIEWLRFALVVLTDELVNGGLEIEDRLKDAVRQQQQQRRSGALQKNARRTDRRKG